MIIDESTKAIEVAGKYLVVLQGGVRERVWGS